MSGFMKKFSGEEGEKIQEISIDQIHVDDQVRKNMDEAKVKELADSIKKLGLQSPIKLRRENNKYIVLFGHRRLEASKKIGKKTISCLVISKPMTEEEIIINQYTENEQRESLNALERIDVYLELKERGFTGKKIAEQLSLSQAQITQGLKAAELPREWLEEAMKKCPEVSIYKLYNVAKIKTERRREQAFNNLLGIEDVKNENRKEEEAPVKLVYTEEQLEYVWTKIKRKVRNNKQPLAALIPPGKLDKLLEDYKPSED